MKACRLFLLLLLPGLGLASETDLLLSEAQNGQPIERVLPKYPISEAKAGKEGWVRVDFVVDEQGQVTDAVVLDSSGVDGFEREALRAVRRWQYEPALVDGEAVQQCYKVQLDFALDRQAQGVTRRFAATVRAIQQRLEDQQLDEAKAQLDALRARPQWNLTEDGWYWMIEALYQEAVGNVQEQVRSLKRVTGITTRRLPDEQLRYVLQKLFVLQTSQSQFAEALDSYEKLQQVPGSDEVVAMLAPYVDQIHTAVKSEQPLLVEARVNERRYWQHHLSRSGFELVQISGQLETLDLRCERQLKTYKAVSGVAWHIPASWGECRVMVKGEPGSVFQLLEVPPVAGAEQAAVL
ncbi:energy transducer TonB [Lacimicrobium sp. SS2-24]|uniref:energy transducer TonB n=1 Tax=Lacimicrobium sp. SS2-24 TaxID=2005569 RepID=UPI000B4B8EA5|nr:energy transducer TonB [Lacimicrobium sp. SS2-24]